MQSDHSLSAEIRFPTLGLRWGEPQGAYDTEPWLASSLPCHLTLALTGRRIECPSAPVQRDVKCKAESGRSAQGRGFSELLRQRELLVLVSRPTDDCRVAFRDVIGPHLQTNIVHCPREYIGPGL